MGTLSADVLALILAFVAQLCTVVWLIATMKAEIKSLRGRMQAQEAHNVGEALAEIKTDLKHVTQWIDKQV